MAVFFGFAARSSTPKVDGSVFMSQWFIDSHLRDDAVHEYVGRSHRNQRHDLERISETHEPRSQPMMTQMPEGQSAIVETDAVPEPSAAIVERNRRYENCVEESCAQRIVPVGLMHSECV